MTSGKSYKPYKSHLTDMRNEKIDISVVIPAFNEAERLPSFLRQVISYCIKSKKIYEIIIVDDGSTDNTFEAASSYKTEFSNLSVIRIKKNMGKGYAVKEGILKSNGEICLFLDADGSVSPEEIEKNIPYILEEDYDIFIGSRALKNEAQVLEVRWYRKILGLLFNFFVLLFLLRDIKDTLCGLKMFKKEVAKSLFSKNRIKGFGFDIEILYLASKMGCRIKEGPISWHYAKGSKVNLFIDPIKMFLNIFHVRRRTYR